MVSIPCLMEERVQDKESNPLDSRTILAIVLVGVVWFGWQTYLSKKYPQPLKTAVATDVSSTTSKEALATGAHQLEMEPGSASTHRSQQKVVPVASGSSMRANQDKVKPEVLTDFESPSVKAKISSYGMGFRNFILKDHKTREGLPVQLGESAQPLFGIRIVGESEYLQFDVQKKYESEFEGVANWNQVQIVRNIRFDVEKNVFENTVRISKIQQGFPGVEVALAENKDKPGKSHFLFPSFEHQELIVDIGQKVERVNLTSQTEKYAQKFSLVKLVGFGSQYFSTAILDKSVLSPELSVESPVDSGDILSFLKYSPSSSSDIELSFLSFAGPKSHRMLKAIDPAMVELINFGMFKAIAEVLLYVLKWLFQILQNWGIAIIALTVLVRLLVLPFNIASYKSMKKMQKIQPLLQSIRERYKEDAQTMQRETMALMKQHKVNPLGGCLPMLLQLPIFFALYQVLGQSVELYMAPFMGWIHDLSIKDPFYVLPILMSIAMWAQQKLTPNPGMDPTQAKIMQYLPLVFCLFMISLPAGLTLYILISTVFGVVQQQLFMRDKNSQKAISKA